MTKRTLSRRDFLRVSAVTVTGAILAGCAPKPTPTSEATKAPEPTSAPVSSAPVEVIFMTGENDLPNDMVTLFGEKNSGIKLTRQQPDAAKFLAMLAANEQVDLFMLVGTYIPAWQRQGIPLDLTNYFANSSVLKTDDLVGPGNNLYVIEGKRYGMVKDWSPDCSVWINKKLWAEAGVPVPDDPKKLISYQQYREWAPDLMKREGDRVTQWGTCFSLDPGQLIHMALTLEPSRSIYSKDFTKLALADDKELTEIVEFFINWKKEGTVPSEINPYVSGAWGGQDWVQGAAAAVQFGYWFGGMAVSDYVSEDDLMLISAPKWGPTYANPTVGGVGAIIVRQTKVADAAWKVFEFFMGEEPAINRAESGWGVPGLKSLLPLMPQDKPWRKQAYDQVQWEIEQVGDQVAQFSPYAVSDVIYAAWGKYMQPVLAGEITTAEFIARVVEDVNEALEEGLSM